MLYYLMIVNKSGGLIYNTALTEDGGIGHPKLSSNEYLVMAGMFHGLNAITTRLCVNAPTDQKNYGIEVLETDTFRLHCLATLTGIKFILTCAVNYAPQNAELCLKRIYEIYADFAMKNPFYSPEMPIRSETFDTQIRERIIKLSIK
ncbi:hypothetical protein MP228_008077 [Amoeboaphelidium protococcarum]|nr:hypothetical protein MP228_008077 [Amoeboaphelidium protococcarum]